MSTHLRTRPLTHCKSINWKGEGVVNFTDSSSLPTLFQSRRSFERGWRVDTGKSDCRTPLKQQLKLIAGQHISSEFMLNLRVCLQLRILKPASTVTTTMAT